MFYIIDFFVFFMASIVTFRAIKKVAKGKNSMLHLAVIVFYIMQVLPIFVGFFGSLDKIQRYYPYMYLAMTDELTSVIYDIFALTGIVVLSIYADKYAKKIIRQSMLNLKLGNGRKILVIISVICMLIPILGIFFAPSPKVYLSFSYFYMNLYNSVGAEYVYHRNVMSLLVYMAFAGTILYYVVAKGNRSIVYLLSTFLITWINGKRTLLVFLLGGMLVIDFLKWDRKNKKYIRRFFSKAIFFVLVVIIYYVFYTAKTGKSAFANDFLLYSTYFSRLCNVKVAIYDLLQGQVLLDYSGQSLIYDCLFFVPRMLWTNKPWPYYRYFTSYCFYGVSDKMVSNMQFQVNMWSEFISNLGIIGFILSLCLVINIVKKSERTNNKVLMLSGFGFVFLYMMFGFEHIVQIVYIVWISANVWEFLFGKNKRMKRIVFRDRSAI